MILNIVQREAAIFLGTPLTVFIATNALFIYRYYRNPQISEQLPERLKKYNTLLFGIVIFAVIMLFTSNNGLAATGMTLTWIAFIAEGEGIIRPKSEDTSQQDT